MIKNIFKCFLLALMPVFSIAQDERSTQEYLLTSSNHIGIQSGVSISEFPNKSINDVNNNISNTERGGDEICEQNQWGENFVVIGMSTGSMIPDFPPNTIIAANDIDVEANSSFGIEKITFEMYMMTMDASTEGMTFDIYLYDNNNGAVGNNITTINDVAPESITLNSRGNYTVIINLPQALEVNNPSDSSKKYWLGLGNEMVEYVHPQSGNILGIPSYWVSDQYQENSESYPAMMQFNGVWEVWVHNAGWKAEGNFIIEGQCEELMSVEDLGKSQFSYYPNPVQDFLNINSAKEIQSISVYNFAGQIVAQNLSAKNGKISLSSLSSGTYVFRATLQGGQIETFKIIKK